MKNPKYFVIVISAFVLSAASAHAAGEILRNADGSIKYMNQYDAMKACPSGTHLPTIRELVQESQVEGAKGKGILELSQVDPKKIPQGFYKISSINPDGQADDFFYSYDDYKAPTGDLGEHWLWSSSVFSVRSGSAYFFMGEYGVVERHTRDGQAPADTYAVFCVSDR